MLTSRVECVDWLAVTSMIKTFNLRANEKCQASETSVRNHHAQTSLTQQLLGGTQ
jgi:hypothetical protein